MPRTASSAVRRFSYDPARPKLANRWRARRPLRFSVSNGYSVFVGFMKVLLPALAVALILLLVAWPQLIPDEGSLGIDLSELSVDQADNLTMLNARFSGYDDKDQPFLVTADVASQAPDNENLIALELPKADITLEDGTWIAVTAREGQYDRTVDILDLLGQVSYFHDRGFELHTEEMQVDMQGGTAMGRTPVTGQGFFGQIEAEGFDLFERGDRIIFTGQSRLRLYPDADLRLSTGLGE